jgi:PAS domain S-box-containing protein
MKSTISILLVEDDEDDYFLTTECLKDIPGKDFDLTWARNYSEAVKQLGSRPFDVCLFDFVLGAQTGLDLLRDAHRMGVDAPIILLTGKGDRAIDYEAMRLGATDYLVKSELKPEPLERAIRYAMGHTAVLRAMKESEKKYRSIFEDSIDVIYLLDEAGLFTDISPSATQLLGYVPDELIGTSLTSLLTPEGVRTAFLNKQNAHATIRDFEVEMVAKNGGQIFCILTCTFHPAVDGRSGYFQGFIHDITQRKKAEQQLLINEKLAATGRFVRMLGHEIRNPLTNINLSVEQMAVENQDAELNDYIDIIRRNSQRIGKLLNDLLESSNPGRLDLKPCSVQELVDKALEIAEDRIRLKEIKVVKDYAPRPIRIKGDEERLKIALLNIVINAVEEMKQGHGELRLTVPQTHDAAAIVIRDNGGGISRENLGRIFDPYFSRKSNGLGLGLATTLTIVQSHHGRVEVKSEVGKGSEFTVYLPLAENV